MIYSSWDIDHDRLKLVILGHFLPFYQKRTQKIKILKKWKKLLEISSLICVPKITIIWFTVPSTVWDRQNVLDHFLSFHCHPDNLENQNFKKLEKTSRRYYHFTNVQYKWQSNDICFLEIWNVTDRIFCNFGWFFALLLH